VAGTVIGHRSGSRDTLAILAACWVAVTVVAWRLYYSAGGGGDAGSLAGSRATSWTLTIPPVILLGLLLTWLVERRRPLPPAERLAILATAGWGVANAFGWTVDVKVGGPTTGLVTGCVLVAASQNRPVRLRALVAVLAGVGGLVAGRLLTGEGYAPLLVAVPLVLGLPAFALAWKLLGVRLPWWPVAGLAVGWGLSWVAAFVVTREFLAGSSAAMFLVVELVGACTLGGALTAWAWRRRTAEPVLTVTLRWALTSMLGVVLGAAVAGALWYLGLAPAHVERPQDLLEVGTTVGLGLAAWFALLPTLRRLIQAPGPRGSS
jgi:hypothetical protein